MSDFGLAADNGTGFAGVEPSLKLEAELDRNTRWEAFTIFPPLRGLQQQKVNNFISRIQINKKN